MPFRSLTGPRGQLCRFSLAAGLIFLAWISWPQSDVWSPAAVGCIGLVGMTLVAGLLSKLTTVGGSKRTSDSTSHRSKSKRSADKSGLLVDRMLDQGRQALLLRFELVTKMTSPQRRRAQHNLCESMALLAAGDVCVTPWKPDDKLGEANASNELSDRRTTEEGFWLDRLQVSNLQFQDFVDEGGYENESFWSVSVRKRIGDFVDRTRILGPRHWKNGKFPKGLENHPVVGICWYEAEAFARWQGKRLPTDTEWMNAACGPLTDVDGHSVQRQYPWGQEPKTGLANLWGADLPNRHPDGTVPADSLPAGATEAGIQQLLGNVWEWTSSEFQISVGNKPVVLDRPMKSLRGGAFDSYFGDQATCQLQSGDSPLARTRNIGFRCAVTASGLSMDEVS